VTPDGTTITYLEATEEDVANGLALARSVLVRGSDNLAPQTARLLRAVGEHTASVAATFECAASEVAITRRELRQLLGWSDMQVRRATDRLVALEYLVVSGGGRGRCRTYHYVADITQVGHQKQPVRPPEGRTGHPLPPGETDELVRLVGLDEVPTVDGEHVDEDEHPGDHLVGPGTKRR